MANSQWAMPSKFLIVNVISIRVDKKIGSHIFRKHSKEFIDKIKGVRGAEPTRRSKFFIYDFKSHKIKFDKGQGATNSKARSHMLLPSHGLGSLDLMTMHSFSSRTSKLFVLNPSFFYLTDPVVVFRDNKNNVYWYRIRF